MKKNIYYQNVFRRDNLFKNFIFDSALKIASYPKMLLEVFLRRNFGERYFSMATAITVAILVLLFPVFVNAIYVATDVDYRKFPSFWANHASTYLFLLAFIFFTVLRWREVKKNPSVFDFARFSLYTGDIHSFFYDLKFFGKRPSVRTIEIFLEPALFLIAGIVLNLLDQYLGRILIFSSIMYSLSYAGQYKKGDDFVMDTIDEMILNEEMESAFVNDETADNTRGVRFHAQKPKAKTLRKKLADSFVENDQDKEEITYAE